MVQTNYIVMVGDLVGSRKDPDRAGLAQMRDATAAAVNARFASALVAPLAFVSGVDEVSCVLRRADCTFDLACALNEYLWPRRFRWGVGEGAIDIGISTGVAAVMDGPAFHAASAGMARARDESLPFALQLARTGAQAQRLVEATAALYTQITLRWTPTAARAVQAYRLHGSQTAAAGQLGVSTQAVSQALQRASYRDLERSSAAIRTWLGTTDHD